MIQTPLNMRRRAAIVLAASALAWSAGSAAQGFPETPRGEARDTYFGTELADPYRWLEDMRSPQTEQWMKAAAAHADRALAAIPGRDAMLARIGDLESGAERTIGRVLRLPGELYVYESRGAQEIQFSLLMRRGLTGEEKLLVDVAALSKSRGVPMAINYFSLSPNGRYLAYGVSERGSEAAVLHLLDVQTGQPVGEPITRADFGVARWAPDSRHFSMVRLRETGADAKDKYQGSASWLVPVEGGFAKARELLGPGTRSVAVDAGEIPTVLFTADGRWLIGLLEQGVRRESRVVIAPAARLADGEAAWSERIDRKDKIVDLAYAQGVLYAVTHEDAPRYRIIAAPIERFSAASARTVVPQSQRVLGMIVAARDALYFEAREGNAKQLWRLPHAPGAQAAQVPLPVQGSFTLRQRARVGSAHPQLDGVLIGLEGWTQARQLYLVAAGGAVRNTGLQPTGRHDAPADIETREVLVTSHDGARVPLSIVYRKGTALNGRNPTLLQGYGAYGLSWEPRFDVARLAWLERGGVIAIANPRGSGIFGQAWYEAGKQATKPNTWRDMIACAEYLVDQGYASPATLAIEGTSAGGITSGRAATVRPDLFAAVVPRVGMLDALRTELEPNGPPNVPEFGTHKTEAGFKSLLAMSTYHHIHPGVRYPAVLLTHGVNDPRVAAWQSAKTAARFAAAAASVTDPRPVLLRLDYDAGHGVGSSKEQRQRERADIYAFLLWQMGAPGFQPDPARR
ncbi:MAG: prolyl oligopeptidase family serine peptidase [Burkholderiales bacterium]|nr:prolyl oligopeptidase family serine peptidase [Burkholderiales bacterium]